MDWFRYYHGTQQDQKLTMIAKKIGVRRCEMTAVWCELMDYASRHVTRGHVTNCDLEVIAFTQDIELEIVTKIYQALEEKNVIKDGRLTNWEKRQPKKEDTTAAERKRKQRARDKEKKEAEEAVKNNESVTNDVTQCHDVSRDVTTEEIRGEEKRVDNNKNNNPNNLKTPFPSSSSPRERGENPRALGTNPRATGSNPRSIGTNPRSTGTNPRAENGSFKNFWEGGGKTIDVLPEDALDDAKQNAPGWDIYHLASVYDDGIRSGLREAPRNVAKAFPGWCKSYTKGREP